MSRVLILGGSGFIGSAFARELAARGIDFSSISRNQCDYTNFSAILSMLKRVRPELVINCSGVTGTPNVDWCELHRKETIAGNVIAAAAISDACYTLGVILGHVSTGCIYNGERPLGAPWTEEDHPNFQFGEEPCSFYSGTKAMAEWKISGNPLAYIWRLRLPFCEEADQKNLITKLVNYPVIFDSPKNSMSHLGECVKACLDTWELGVKRGIYNVVNPGALTNREIVADICEILKPTREFEFCDAGSMFFKEQMLAPRSNCVLSSKKLSAAGIELRPVAEAMVETLKNYKPS